jgi:hypothetical protein
MKRIAVIIAALAVGALAGVVLTTAFDRQSGPECPILTAGCPTRGAVTATTPLSIMGKHLKAAVGTPGITATEAEGAAQSGVDPRLSGSARLEQAVLAVLPRSPVPTPVGQAQQYRPDTLVWAIHEWGVCGQATGAEQRCFPEALVLVDAKTGNVLGATAG